MTTLRVGDLVVLNDSVSKASEIVTVGEVVEIFPDRLISVLWDTRAVPVSVLSGHLDSFTGGHAARFGKPRDSAYNGNRA